MIGCVMVPAHQLKPFGATKVWIGDFDEFSKLHVPHVLRHQLHLHAWHFVTSCFAFDHAVIVYGVWCTHLPSCHSHGGYLGGMTASTLRRS